MPRRDSGTFPSIAPGFVVGSSIRLSNVLMEALRRRFACQGLLLVYAQQPPRPVPQEGG
jgi:hypothetical protein